jgi:hypothetical protein
MLGRRRERPDGQPDRHTGRHGGAHGPDPSQQSHSPEVGDGHTRIRSASNGDWTGGTLIEEEAQWKRKPSPPKTSLPRSQNTRRLPSTRIRISSPSSRGAGSKTPRRSGRKWTPQSSRAPRVPARKPDRPAHLVPGVPGLLQRGLALRSIQHGRYPFYGLRRMPSVVTTPSVLPCNEGRRLVIGSSPGPRKGESPGRSGDPVHGSAP